MFLYCVYCVVQERVSNLLEMELQAIMSLLQLTVLSSSQHRVVAFSRRLNYFLFFTTIKVSIFRTGVMAQKALTGKPNLSDSRNPHGGRTDFLKVASDLYTCAVPHVRMHAHNKHTNFHA